MDFQAQSIAKASARFADVGTWEQAQGTGGPQPVPDLPGPSLRLRHPALLPRVPPLPETLSPQP
ncbi:hypothetical protein T484DRAFT_1950468 [Baffinella frigidus]|nr:hypothetical protein T484DRAFT_1950468 [Cryptophyta sp. CCMP2293]